MEIKIECSCGSRYKFDVEPENGRCPTPLACPSCQASWTEQTNELIARSLGEAAPAPAFPVTPAAPVVRIVSVGTMAPPTPSAPKLGLRLSNHAPSEAPASNVAVPDAPEPAPVPASGGRHMPRVVTLDPVLEPQVSMGNFGMGVLGAGLGAALGSGAYYLLFIHTSVRLKLLALGIGFLAGMGARVLSKDRSKELGAIVGVLAIATIVGTQYLIAQTWFRQKESAPASGQSNYEERVAEARKVVAAIPNGTDQEIRLYLAGEMADEGENPDPKSVEREEIAEFRETDLPQYRELASGKISKEDYDKAQTVLVKEEDRRREKDNGKLAFRIIFIALTLSKFNIACMIGAAGIGYKMTADA
jgi:hypothetical protein